MNVSSAVRQQRIEPADSLDDFPTPPWATRALCDWLARRGEVMRLETVREPAANRGHMVRPLREYFGTVEASDIHDYGAGFPVSDYLAGEIPPAVDWTITNPPFRLAENFITRAIASSRRGTAVIVRTAFLEGIGRHQRLFQHAATRPSHVLQFSERVVMHKGRLAPEGSTATAYCWVIFAGLGPDGLPPYEYSGETKFDWIAPCRRFLERPEDYMEEEK